MTPGSATKVSRSLLAAVQQQAARRPELANADLHAVPPTEVTLLVQLSTARG